MNDEREQTVAFLQNADGESLVGYGPFAERASPPPDGVAFYRNDFWLSDPKPWKIPSRVAQRPRLPAGRGGTDGMTVDWEELSSQGFSGIYEEVQREIEGGAIQKAVPVVTERGSIRTGTIRDLPRPLNSLSGPLRGYGWLGQTDSFLGSTPELLFSLADGGLDTMALAGTARRKDRDRFETDRKEIREHEIVTEDIVAKLSEVGAVETESRRVMDLGPLLHFETPIRAEVQREVTANDLVRLLHPTPALGPLPRTNRSMELQRDWRERAGCPAVFGAPFGVSIDGVLTLVVAIRMVACRGSELLLPAGCGVIGESRFSTEWRELQLKREAVKATLGLDRSTGHEVAEVGEPRNSCAA